MEIARLTVQRTLHISERKDPLDLEEDLRLHLRGRGPEALDFPSDYLKQPPLPDRSFPARAASLSEYHAEHPAC